MFDTFLQAVLSFSLEQLMYLALGVCVGLTVGIVPGLGGIVGMSILLPFVFGMEPTAGLAMLIGMAAVVQTSDIFPAVLFGIPGTTGGAALIVDGYPLGRRGEAMRALRMSFAVSMVGGVIGGLVLLFFLPLARPLMLALGTPELFVLTLFGLSMVGVLSEGSAFAGIASGLAGMLLSAVGIAIGVPYMRYTFGSAYLGDGVSLVLVGLGIFGISELVGLLLGRKQDAQSVKAVRNFGLGHTLRELFANKWLILRSSAIGSALGVVPGIGGAAIDWILYGITVQSSRDKSQYGKGDIRGVIGPGSADNAKEGGVLIPTLFFGIPGSGTSAILLGGLVLMGIQAGPDLAKPENAHITYVVVITLILASILGAILCWILSRWVSLVSTISIKVMAPIIWILLAGAAYQASHQSGDIVLLIVLGAFAVAMTHANWPKAPLLVGFVLGPSAERYLSISTARYGTEWLTRPGVIVLAALVVLSAVVGFWSTRRQNQAAEPVGARWLSIGFSVFALLVFSWLAWIASGFIVSVRWFPLGIATAGALFTFLHLANQLLVLFWKREAAPAPEILEAEALPTGDGAAAVAGANGFSWRSLVRRQGPLYWLAWIIGYAIIAFVIGQIQATAVWTIAFLMLESKRSWIFSLIVAAVLVLLQLVLEYTAGLQFMPGILWG